MYYFMHVMYTHTGPQGEKGELGPTGPPGLPGEKGARGKQGKRVSFSEVLRRTTTDQIDRTKPYPPPPRHPPTHSPPFRSFSSYNHVSSSKTLSPPTIFECIYICIYTRLLLKKYPIEINPVIPEIS